MGFHSLAAPGTMRRVPCSTFVASPVWSNFVPSLVRENMEYFGDIPPMWGDQIVNPDIGICSPFTKFMSLKGVFS